MAILETVNLTKKFGKFTALDKVNLAVNEGEVFGFIGPNGAGKTTTLRVLLGILQATEGSAGIFGQDAWKNAVEIHKRIAYVPGDVNLWSNLTGGEVIDLFVSLRKTHDRNYRERLIEMFDLDPSKKCRTYSKGNRQKVALVAAFSSDADLYILDEPTSGLDPLMEKVFQECVEEQKKAGKSILLSSHILSEVERLCDRVGIIREGRIIDTGTLTELRHLTRVNISTETVGTVTGLEALPGIEKIERYNGNSLSFQVDSQNLGAAVSLLSTFNIVKLESTPPNLEDLFMSHYSGKGGAGNASPLH